MLGAHYFCMSEITSGRMVCCFQAIRKVAEDFAYVIGENSYFIEWKLNAC